MSDRPALDALERLALAAVDDWLVFVDNTTPSTVLSLIAYARRLEGERDGLLSRAHRDGGHYHAEHGTAKAVEDAHMVIATAFAERDCYRAALESARESMSANLPTVADETLRSALLTPEAEEGA